MSVHHFSEKQLNYLTNILLQICIYVNKFQAFLHIVFSFHRMRQAVSSIIKSLREYLFKVTIERQQTHWPGQTDTQNLFNSFSYMWYHNCSCYSSNNAYFIDVFLLAETKTTKLFPPKKVRHIMTILSVPQITWQ